MGKMHIGRKIKEVVDQSRFSITEFAEMINRSRTVAYDIFERDTLDTGLLQQISKVLNHNFFHYYNSEMLPLLKEDKAAYLTQIELLSALNEEIGTLRKQLAELEVKYNSIAKKDSSGKKTYSRKRPKK